MVLWNNHLGGLSKVTSYQSQSVCLFFFLPPTPPRSLFYSFLSVFVVAATISQSLPGLYAGAPLARRSMAGHVREAAPPPLDAITD